MTLSPSDIAEIIGKQFWRMVLIGGVCAGAAAWAMLSSKPVYEARTLLLYKLGQEYIYVPDAADMVSGVRAPDPGDLLQIIAAEMQIVVNRDLRRRFLEEYGVDRVFPGVFPDAATNPASFDLAAESLREIVTVGLVPNTLMVEVRVRHGDPVIAAEMSNRLVDLYLERRGQVFSQRDSDYFRARLSAAHRGVETIETRMSALLNGVDPLVFETERDIKVERQAHIARQLADIEAELAALSGSRSLLGREIAATPETIVEYRNVERNPMVAAAQNRIVMLESEREAAAASLGAAHPTVRALEREIEGLRDVAAREPSEIETGGRIATNPARREAEMRLAQTEAELRRLEGRRAHLLAERESNTAALVQAASVSSELQSLRRAAETEQSQIAQFDSRLRELTAQEVEGRSSLGSVRILEAAEPPVWPIGAPKSMRLAVALFFGAVVALAAGALSYLANPTVLTAGMLERRLGAPTLAEIGPRRWRRPVIQRAV